MPITQTQWLSFGLGGNSSLEVTINIAPATVAVETSLSRVSGGGTKAVGIRKIRKRLTSGTDQDIDFGDNYAGWPAVYFGRGTTSIAIDAKTSAGYVTTITGEDLLGFDRGTEFHDDALLFVARIDWWI